MVIRSTRYYVTTIRMYMKWDDTIARLIHTVDVDRF